MELPHRTYLPLLLLGTATVMICVGCFAPARHELKLVAEAKKHAMPRLREHGIVDLDSDAKVSEANDETTLTATGRDIADEIHDVVIVWKVDAQRTWNMQRMVIDDETEWVKD